MDSNLSAKFDYSKNSLSGVLSGSVTASGVSSGSVDVGSTYIPGSRSIQPIPIEQRPLNVDPNPIIIKKKPDERVEHIQNVSLRFLKPTPAAQPGDITIVQDADTRAPSPPPLILRKEPPVEPIEPQPLVLREKPPVAPTKIPDKIITIPGKILQKPRKIIIEHVFREVRYENVPPQFTREQIKKYIKDKLRRQKSSGAESLASIEYESKESGSAHMLTNVSALINDNVKNPTPNVSHASASFTTRPQSRSHGSVELNSSNNSAVLRNITNKSHASLEYTSNNSADISNIISKPQASNLYTSGLSADLSNITSKPQASIQYTSNNSINNISNIIENNNFNNNNNNVSFSGNSNIHSSQEINASAPMQTPQQSHVNASMPLHEIRPTPMPYYPGYEPPQSQFFGVNNFSRQNPFYATGPIRPFRSLARAPHIIQYENNYSSLSADFIPNRDAMTEMDIYNQINAHQSNFRRSASLMRPHHEDADSGLRLLGFNL